MFVPAWANSIHSAAQTTYLVAFWVDRKRLDQQHLCYEGEVRVLLAATEIEQQEVNIQLTAKHHQG